MENTSVAMGSFGSASEPSHFFILSLLANIWGFPMIKVSAAAFVSAETIEEYSQNNNGVNVSYQNKLLYSCTTASNPF